MRTDLRNVFDRVKGPNAKGWYSARCPGPNHKHDDKNPSLGFKDDGTRWVLKCQAGCDREGILSPVGLSWEDLYEFGEDTTPPDLGPFAEEPEPVKPRPGDTVYEYTDRHGEYLYAKVRFGRRKGFLWRDIPADEKERVLYRLPDIANSDGVVYYVEGEKDADNLAALGLTATTAGGADDWRDHFADMLADRDVVILPDNDKAGQKLAARVKTSLAPAVRKVTTLELPGLPEKGDVSDWLTAGGTADELTRLAKAAAEAPIPRFYMRDDLLKDKAETDLTVVHSIGLGQVDECLHGGFADGQCYALCSGTGRGKTSLAMQIAKHWHRHRPVVVWSLEMPSLQLAARMAGMETGHHYLDALRDEDKWRDTEPLIPDNVCYYEGRSYDELVAGIRRTQDRFGASPLVIVDYIQKLGGQADDLRIGITRAMEQLRETSKQERVPTLIVSAIGRDKTAILKKARELEPADLEGLSRESGAVEYDSAGVLVISWDPPTEAGPQTGLITVAKARYGERAHVEATFDGRTGRWTTGPRHLPDFAGGKVTDDDLSRRLLDEASKSRHVTLSALVNATKGNRKRLMNIARDLVDEGSLVISNERIYPRNH